MCYSVPDSRSVLRTWARRTSREKGLGRWPSCEQQPLVALGPNRASLDCGFSLRAWRLLIAMSTETELQYQNQRLELLLNRANPLGCHPVQSPSRFSPNETIMRQIFDIPAPLIWLSLSNRGLLGQLFQFTWRKNWVSLRRLSEERKSK